ncbi:MAG: hypothetical protein BM564_09870 [Bacteroidetes bacterium MedPE-SWsnd-G2]|mgnify:CR=1 FL=1|nr:MAG: hypothetical protein BM564_09870 [Bacteroidetes bacterium MedPE-SWsnd-G2]
MHILKIIIVTITVSLFTTSVEQSTQDIEVNITGLSNNEGKMVIALFDNESVFLKTEYKSYSVDIRNKSCRVVFENVPEGTYAISTFHDENENGKLDTNALGIPNEAYRSSNNEKGSFGPPRWKKAKFEVKGEKVIQNIKL